MLEGTERTANMIKIFYTFCILISFLTTTVYAVPSTFPTIQSATKTFDFTTGEWVLTGNVTAQTEIWEAEADYVRIHPINLTVQASGNVKLTTRGVYIQADRVTLNSQQQVADLSGNLKISFDAIRATASSGTYHLKNKTADLFGEVTLSPPSGGFINSHSAHFTLADRKVIFTSPIEFELYKEHSGSGISGHALSGDYSLLGEKATFSQVTYHPIPSGVDTSVDTLSYSSK